MRKNVAVIGGGVAGLCAAFSALDSGHFVTVYESASRLGGRADGRCGRHLVTTAYIDFFRLLDRIGSRDKLSLAHLSIGVLINRRKAFWHLVHPVFGAKYLELGFLSSDMLSLFDKLLSVPALSSLKDSSLSEPDNSIIAGNLDGQAFRKIEGTSIKEYFNQERWPKNLVNRFGLPAARSVFNMKPEEASAHIFQLTLKRILADPEKQAGWIKGDNSELLADPALATLTQEGAKVKISCPVNNLRRTRCGWSINTKDGGDSYDAVIVTVPPWKFGFLKELGEIAPLLNQAEAIGGNRIVTISGLYENADTAPGALCETENEMGVWFAQSSPDGGVKIERVLSGIPSESKIDRNVLKSSFEKEAEALFNATGLIGKISITNYDKASPQLLPGQKRPLIRQAKGLYYASDWTATDLPATIESAARAGWIAGELLSDDFTLTCSD